MTIQESIDLLQERIELIEKEYANDRVEDYKTALGIAINALKKQIPKKPSGDLHSVPHYRCKACKCSVVMYKSDGKPIYCMWCGQKIDWKGSK